MATTTSKLSLTKPLSTESMAQGDNVLSGNYDIIDGMVGASVVSVSADIASPIQTQLNFETTTNEANVYDGTAWNFLGGPEIAQGKRGSNETVGKITISAGTAERVLNAVFEAVVGRSYLVSWKIVSRAISGTDFRAYTSLYFTAAAGTESPFSTANFVTSQDCVVFVEGALVQQFSGFFEFVPAADADPAAISCWLSNKFDGDIEVSPFSGDQSSIAVEDWSS